MPPGTDGSRLISSAIELQASSRSSSPHGLYDTKHSYSLLSFLLIFLLCYFPFFSFPFLFILTFVPFLLPPFFNCLMTFFHSSYVLTSFHIFPSSHHSCYLPFFLLKSSLLLIISWFLPCILISIFLHSFLPSFLPSLFLSFFPLTPSYLPISLFAVFLASTVVGAMPPKLSLRFSTTSVPGVKVTLIAAVTILMSSSRRGDCL